jgi:hypothetical protein
MGCRNHATDWTHEQILAWVSDEYEGAFDEPLHQLMRELTMLGLTHAWYPTLRDFHFNRCVELLNSLDFPDVLSKAGLTEDECDEFINDLTILRVLQG